MQRVSEQLRGLPAITPFSKTASVLSVHDMTPSAIGIQTPRVSYNYLNGEKFVGGWGENTHVYEPDYWMLRARSNQMFDENLYARGIIRRLVTNEINTGLTPEASPEETILGLPDDSLSDWSEDVETRYQLYANSPSLCDYAGQRTMGQIQATVRMESLIAGDILVVLIPHELTGLPMVKLIDGNAVVTPSDYNPQSVRRNRIDYGVELDKRGRQVAYHVQQSDGTTKRIPAYGPRTGRRMAWLVYGCERRLVRNRGVPFLGLILQSIKELDRYRDSVQRKALINSILAMFIKKTEDKVGTKPLTNGSIRKQQVIQTNDAQSAPRTYNIAEQIPGLVLQELQQGEEPVGFNSAGTDLGFGAFEKVIVSAMAWANEIPPQVLLLDFSQSYSASQAATNEFKIYLNRQRGDFAHAFCHPIYTEWLLASVTDSKIDADGLFESWIDYANQHDVFNAWTNVDWNGAIKPSVDLLKQVNAYKKAVDEGLITREQSCKELFGRKYSKTVKRLRIENEQLAEALGPLIGLKNPDGSPSDKEEEDD